MGPVSAAYKKVGVIPSGAFSSRPCHLHQAASVDVARHIGPTASHGIQPSRATAIKPLIDQDLDDSEGLSTCSNSHVFGDKFFSLLFYCGAFQAGFNPLLRAYVSEGSYPSLQSQGPPEVSSHWTLFAGHRRFMLAPEESVGFPLWLCTAL